MRKCWWNILVIKRISSEGFPPPFGITAYLLALLIAKANWRLLVNMLTPERGNAVGDRSTAFKMQNMWLASFGSATLRSHVVIQYFNMGVMHPYFCVKKTEAKMFYFSCYIYIYVFMYVYKYKYVYTYLYIHTHRVERLKSEMDFAQ